MKYKNAIRNIFNEIPPFEMIKLCKAMVDFPTLPRVRNRTLKIRVALIKQPAICFLFIKSCTGEEITNLFMIVVVRASVKRLKKIDKTNS